MYVFSYVHLFHVVALSNIQLEFKEKQYEVEMLLNFNMVAMFLNKFQSLKPPTSNYTN